MMYILEWINKVKIKVKLLLKIFLSYHCHYNNHYNNNEIRFYSSFNRGNCTQVSFLISFKLQNSKQ